MVGVLIVSHSKKAAEGIYELAVQMAGKDHRVVAVGGMGRRKYRNRCDPYQRRNRAGKWRRGRSLTRRFRKRYLKFPDGN